MASVPQSLLALRHLSAAGAAKAVAGVWLNPRAYDHALEAKALELGNSAEGKSLTTFLHYWKALDGVALSLVVKDSPELVLSVHASSNRLPEPARKVVLDMATPSEVWGALPADSILAVAGRADLGALLETLPYQTIWVLVGVVVAASSLLIWLRPEVRNQV